jgi:glycosyltransferase involved in cell wall biosynthesis
MINKIRKKLFSGAETARRVQEVCGRLSAIRADSAVVALYGSPTHGHWLGIANATKGLYKEAALEIPQSYSNPVFSETQINMICQKIKDLKFQKVIISGFALYFFDFIDKLHSSCTIETLFHGTISEFHNPVIQKQVQSLINYSKENKIKELLFVKEGLDKVFTQLYGLKASHQPLNTPHIPANLELIKLDPAKIHIGVFGGDTFNKNLHNQVIYALMNENTVVHVLDKHMFDYLGMGDRIVGHGNNLPKEKFLGIIGAMTVNLYMSYSESWGLVAYESEAMGVPAVRMDDINYYEKIKKAIESK